MKQQQYADIQWITEVLPITGARKVHFDKWIGEKHWPIRLSVKEKKLIPYPMLLVDYDPLSLVVTYVRADAFFLYRWLFLARFHCKKLCQYLESRIVLTFYVWGVGSVDPGETPTWCNLWRREG